MPERNRSPGASGRDGLRANQPVRMLHLEDSDRDAELIHRTLEAEGLACEIIRTTNRAEFESALAQDPLHVILCDYDLPHYDGIAALRLARESRAEVPVILVSGSLSEEDAVKCLHLGATDYVPKQRLGRLVPAVTRALREAEEQRRTRQSEAELRESEERFRLLAERGSEVFWFVGRNPDRVLYISPSVERIWGIPPARFYEELDTWANAIHPEDKPRVGAAWESFLLGKEPTFEQEYRVVRPDGSIRWVLGSGTPIHDETGEVVRLGGLARDVTERKALQAQLLQAQKMESVGQLASGIAHDFNNLLTVISSTAELAEAALPGSDPLREELAEIRHAGAKAAALTRQLLAFSRKQILQPSVVNLNDLVRNLESMLRRVLGETVELSLSLAADLVSVKVDPGQIEQVILNLAINSRDAMPNGGKLSFETRSVTVEGTHAGPDGPGLPGLHAMLVIADTGVGMDEATQQRIFEPFFTTKEPGKGTGLGLSTAYGIIEQSGGNVSVTSAVGRGTSITITLPAAESPEDDSWQPPVAAIAAPDERAAATILVVEDDEAIRRLAVRILSAAGYTVLPASDGAEALALLARHESPVHLLLTDMVMPGMSGRELAERLAASHPETRVLLTSGYTADAAVHNDVLDADVHFIAKPYAPSSLTAKVREVLRSRHVPTMSLPRCRGV